MSSLTDTPWQPKNPRGLARQFSRLGWIGFWIQLVLLFIPIGLLIYVLLLSSPESAQQRGIDLSNYLSLGSLVVMIFTTFWFYRYTRLGRRIGNPDTRPVQSKVTRTLWIGIWACCIGIFFSMLLMISAMGRLLFVLMANPQTGIQIAQALGGDPTKSLSAMDAVSLSSLLFVLTAELVLLVFSLWLLFRTSRSTAETDTTLAKGNAAGSDAL